MAWKLTIEGLFKEYQDEIKKDEEIEEISRIGFTRYSFEIKKTDEKENWLCCKKIKARPEIKPKPTLKRSYSRNRLKIE